jgi:hypothetical protein
MVQESGCFRGNFASFDLAFETAEALTSPWTIERQTCREGRSICTADRGHSCVDIIDRVVVAKGPRSNAPREGYVRVEVCGRVIDIPEDLATAAQLRHHDYGRDAAVAAFAIALSEGLDGEAAVLRSVAIRRASVSAAEDRAAALKAADTQLHAARVGRQAAMLECRARGVSAEIEDR